MQASSANFPASFNPAMAMPVPWREMLSHRGALVRFAKARLHDPMLAEDVVHDVFEAVLAGRALFAGRSTLRSWLTGILKHKIVDLVRQRAVYDSLDANDGAADTVDHGASDAFGATAFECPRPRPDELAEQRERLAHALARIDALPVALREVMQLRVLQDQATEVVCRKLAITEDNLFVRLHRARKQLLS